MGQLTVNYKVISIFKKDFWKKFIDIKDESITDTNEVKSKKTPIKLDEKVELVPATEAIEDISTAIPSPVPKKKRTIKKRPKLILVESSNDKVVPEKPIVPNAEKIFNPLTNRHVKNTSANRKKIVLVSATAPPSKYLQLLPSQRPILFFYLILLVFF